MQIIHRRRHHEDAPPVLAPANEPEGAPAPGVAVRLSPGVIDLEAALSRQLGPGFCVQAEGSDVGLGAWSGAGGVMIVGPLGAAAMAFLRASHPDVVLLVVDRRWHVPDPNEAVIHLEAGADGYLASPVAAEVASHVRALVRRPRSTARDYRCHPVPTA